MRVYQSQLAGIVPLTIRGVIWYQGENDGRNTLYHMDLKKMIDSWREVFGNPDMPFYLCQIGPTTYAGGRMQVIWESQNWVQENVPNVFLGASNDVLEVTNTRARLRDDEKTGFPLLGSSDPHPPNKHIVAGRLANVALQQTYGQQIDHEVFPPTFDSCLAKGGKMLVKFKHVGTGLKTDDDKAPNWFEVSDGTKQQDRDISPLVYHKAQAKIVQLDAAAMLAQFWWLLPLAFLKPILTSITLGGGGSGGIFAPSLFLGATTGACFGLLCNIFVPGISANPGVYAIVGMGAVVAGTTHGTLSAIIIVYEMTGEYRIILPIMIAAGLASVIARLVERESIYTLKLARRAQTSARGHDVQRLEHIMVRDVMIRRFPTVHPHDDLREIVRVARENSHIESLPVMNDDGKLVGIIRPGDLQRVLDSDIPPHLINAEDVSLMAPIALRTDANLLEALSDFGACDVETLPVVSGQGESRRVVGLLLRNDVMRRYREEMLRAR